MNDPLAARARGALEDLLPDARVLGSAPLGSGHIHETRVARCEVDSAERRYLVQRINTSVFPHPERVNENLARISEHIAEVLRARSVRDPERRHLRLVRAPDGRTLHRDDEGGVWRVLPFVENTRAYDLPGSPARAHEAARAFGAFLADLAGLGPDALHETIPRFHDLDDRISAFEAAVQRDALGRAAAIGAEIDAVRRHGERIRGAVDVDALPRRAVHNDCKLNNLLFDEAGDVALCVVDLDTVMAGRALFDFGELVRTAACTAAEDEPDPARVGFDLPLFDALAAGFVKGARGTLSRDELASLADAGPRMALENAVRFLADHLVGDSYFRITRPDHNLDRARTQLRLVSCMLDAESHTRARCAALAEEAT